MSVEGSDFEEDHGDQEQDIMDEEILGDDQPFDGAAQEADATPNLKIQQKIGDRTCATYTFEGEDHTLGNLLRYSLIKNPEVEFCGYSITHPSENTVNLRLQTTGRGTNDILLQGFETMQFMSEVAETKFTEALKKKKAEKKAAKKAAKTK